MGIPVNAIDSQSDYVSRRDILQQIGVLDTGNGLQFLHLKNYQATENQGYQFALLPGATELDLQLADLQAVSALSFVGILKNNVLIKCNSNITKMFRITYDIFFDIYSVTIQFGTQNIVLTKNSLFLPYIAFTDPNNLDPNPVVAKLKTTVYEAAINGRGPYVVPAFDPNTMSVYLDGRRELRASWTLVGTAFNLAAAIDPTMYQNLAITGNLL